MPKIISAKAKPKTKKWLVDTDAADAAIDEAMEKILKRDGRRIYEAASGDLLTMYANTIVQLDGRPQRLVGMLHQIEAMWAHIEQEEPTASKETITQRFSRDGFRFKWDAKNPV
jgi:hypothetical protein